MSVYYDERDNHFAELPIGLNATVAAIIFAIICVAMMWFAFPRMLAGIPAEDSANLLARINHESRMKLYPPKDPVNVEDIEASLAALDKAIKLTPKNGELYIRRATLRQHRLGKLSSDPTSELQKMREDALLAGKYAPSDPYGWFMIAFAEQALNGKMTPLAENALSSSLLLGRSESPLILPRITMGLSYWDELSPDLKSLIQNQIAIALRHWHLIKPFGTYIANLEPAQGLIVMSIVENVPHIYPKGVQRLRNMTNLNIECEKDRFYHTDCNDL